MPGIMSEGPAEGSVPKCGARQETPQAAVLQVREGSCNGSTHGGSFGC